jgi:hypothetical protein
MTITTAVSSDSAHLRVVLLCKGRGGDKASYRPNSDESQWWGRRDALVRCITSLLFGPDDEEVRRNRNGSDRNAREVVLLFDEDLARLHLARTDCDRDGESRYSSRNCSHDLNDVTATAPTEQTILHLLKRAAQQVRQPVRANGLQCTMFLDPADANMVAACSPSSSSESVKYQSGNNAEPPQHSNLPAGMDTKRQVLEYLQKECSISFLRSQALNSSSEVI